MPAWKKECPLAWGRGWESGVAGSLVFLVSQSFAATLELPPSYCAALQNLRPPTPTTTEQELPSTQSAKTQSAQAATLPPLRSFLVILPPERAPASSSPTAPARRKPQLRRRCLRIHRRSRDARAHTHARAHPVTLSSPNRQTHVPNQTAPPRHFVLINQTTVEPLHTRPQLAPTRATSHTSHTPHKPWRRQTARGSRTG